MDLSGNELERYARQIGLPGFGTAGQDRIKRGSVLVVGLGGLGSPAAFYLAAAGIGRLGVADSETVELSNLQRQILHSTPDQGMMKTDSAAGKLTLLNPEVKLEVHPHRVEAKSIGDLFRRYDFILDCTDDAQTKFLISDAAVRLGKPFCHAGVKAYTGQMFVYQPDEQAACLRCLFPQPLAAEKEAGRTFRGVFGVVPGVIGTLQANAALNYFLDPRSVAVNRLLIFNAQTMSFRHVRLHSRPDCPICSQGGVYHV